MYNLQLTAEQLEFRDTVRDFVAQEVKPIAIKPERLEPFEQPLMLDILDKASQMGLRTMALSEDNGGAGADRLTSCIVTEELAAGDVDIAAVLAETSALSHVLFDRLMSPVQRERFLPSFVADDRYHLACAEREVGTDTRIGINYHRDVPAAVSVTTKAVRGANGDFVVNGAKLNVVNAPVAKLFVVQVALESGHGWLLIPRETAGLTVREQPQAKRPFHGTGGEVTFADCRVPADNLIAHKDADVLLGAAGDGRLHDLALMLGVGRAAHEAAIDYAGLRVQGGRRTIEHQAIGTKLAEVAIGLEVARGAVWRAAFAADHPEAVADRSLPDLPLATIARVFTAATVYRGAKDSAEVFGAMGVMRDMPPHKYIHDAFVSLHAGDGNADAKLRIAEALAGHRHA